MPERLSSWWSALDPAERRRTSLFCLIGLGYLVHYLVYCIPQPFFIEDAGISFAFARNWVDGEGFVPWAGAERVEGFSNPLWTFLIAGFYAFGVEPWTISKIMGAAFGLVAMAFVYGLARRARPSGAGDPGDGDASWHADMALLGPAMLAVSPQFVIWNACGLENSLFVMLLAAGSWRLVRETEDGNARWPWSAVLFFLLCMTRPEGMMYAAIAAAVRVAAAVADRKPRGAVAWLGALAVPWLAYSAWRYWYFAWEFPNTYYAKLGLGERFRPFAWSGGGWGYVKKYLLGHGIAWALPLLALALVPPRRVRGWVVLGILVLALAVLIGWDGRKGLSPIPWWWRGPQRHWVEARVWAILGMGVLAGLATLFRPGWRSRALLWAVAASGTFFALYVGGDWMDGHRWFNVIGIGLFPLLALGLADLLGRTEIMGRPMPRLGFTPRAMVVAVALTAFVSGEVYWSNRFANNPETSVRDVHRRVRYMEWVQKRLDLDRVALMDVDMGAHLWFTDWGIVDMAGLVDVPIARHRRYDKDFMREYVFEERNPEFAHVHANWAKTTHIPDHKEWKERYLEIPGYPLGGKKLHVGNHVRKDLFITEGEPVETERTVRFDRGIRMLDWSLPSPEVASGGQVYLRTAWAAGGLDEGFRILAFLDDGAGHRASTVLPPGFDWYKPEGWKPAETVAGRFWVQVPDGFPEGTYDLGIALLDEKDGGVFAVQPAAPSDAQAPVAPPDPFLAGAWRVADAVRIVSYDAASAAAEEDRKSALDAAATGECERAWEHWKDATRHVSRTERYKDEHERDVKRAVATCHATRSDSMGTAEERGAALVEARKWDHRTSAVVSRTVPLAAEFMAAGDEARATEDWEGAYAAYKMAVSLDPQLAWARRRAEEARDHRLGIDGDEPSSATRVPAVRIGRMSLPLPQPGGA